MANNKRAYGLDTRYFRASVRQGNPSTAQQKAQDAVIRRVIMQAAVRLARGEK